MRIFRQELEKNIVIFEIIFEMKFRAKQALFRYFLAEIKKNFVVIFEITTLKFVKQQHFVKK